MKNYFAAIVFISATTVATAQGDTHQLKILKDDPHAVSDHLIGINGCHAQFSKNEQLKAGLGTEVLWGTGSNMQVQSSFTLYYLTLRNVDGPDFAFEAGAAYTLGEKSKTGGVKIILSHKEEHYDTPTEHVRTSETKYINSEATYLRKTKVRTGYYMKKAGMDYTDEALSAPAAYTGIGVYGGIEWSKQACLFSEVDGKKGITSGYTRFYIDGIFLPVSRFDIATAVKPGKGGFRIGYEAFYNPNKKNNPEYGKLAHYQVYPSLFWKIEAGMRGGEGWFFNMGLGFLVYKNK